MKEQFIEWFTKGNNGVGPEVNDDGEFSVEKTQHMFEAWMAGRKGGERYGRQADITIDNLEAGCAKYSTKQQYNVTAVIYTT
ncbi:hypothetical protein RG27_15200 [Escherichia coli]|uniref:hypothetical protein n=1 Tax=Escherichia coli TaxID=562 RepID=UPI00092DE0A5|nr:hypothetical protein [Escherichia coli]APJ72921.1 hypothetical protein RG27_15200 [Escherichia coli]HBB8704252.1 hypothetical protein [Escherichia coli]HDX7380572.1 hypothetical protein [Escherichia coli]